MAACPRYILAYHALILYLFTLTESAILPPLIADGNGNIVIDGNGSVFEAGSEPLSPDTTAQSVTIRNTILHGVVLLPPTRAQPVALATSGAFGGVWRLENIVLYTSSCRELDDFGSLACLLQPAVWIAADGWSVTILSFSPPSPLAGTFTLANVTLTCDEDAQAAAAASAAAAAGLPAPAPSRVAACVTASLGSQAALLGLLSDNATLYGNAVLPPPSYRVHITLSANLSLDVAAWSAVRPVLRRPNSTTSITGADCSPGARVTALDMRGGTGLMSVEGGALLRMACLELGNLATDTARNLPRGLLSAAVWAVDVDTRSGSRLLLDNCTVVLTKDEFVWQSYYLAQSLASTAGSSIANNIATFLPTFQATISSTALRWLYVSSPHTLWRDCTLTASPTVFPTSVPNSFVMRYLGLSTYLSDVLVVRNCSQLLATVSNASAVAPIDPARPPRSVLLAANISIADCWPAPARGAAAASAAAAAQGGGSGGGVAVTAPSLTLMGLPDRTTTLDLGGRADAFLLSAATHVQLRYLSLTGLATHEDEGSDDEAGSAAASMASVTGIASEAQLELAVALLWAFHYSRRVQQVQLEAVTLVLPPAELQQYGNVLAGSATIPYFRSLGAFLVASSDVDENATATAAKSSPSAAGAAPSPLVFHTMYLPGMRGTNVSVAAWPGMYQDWSLSMYDSPDGSTGGSGAQRWAAWRVGVLVAGLVVVCGLLVFAAVALYSARARGLGAHASAASGGGRGGAKRRRPDVEAGGGDGGRTAAAGAAGDGGGGGALARVAERRPLYDSFDDPAFELDFFKGGKPSAADVQDILARINTEAAEFNMQMTEILGFGSFGVVYGGFWHGMKCAIKTMVFTESPLPLLEGQRARQQCIRESAFCCTMHHPNVVATHHFYLKSAKRANMFDELLQQMAASHDDESDSGHRRRGEGSGSRRGRASNSDRAPAADAEGAERGRVVTAPRGWLQTVRPIRPRPAAVTDWRLYLIQEYCDGGTLRQAVDAGKLFRHGGAARGVSAEAESAALLRHLPSGVSEATPTVMEVLMVARGGGDRGGDGGGGNGGGGGRAHAPGSGAAQPGATSPAHLAGGGDGASGGSGGNFSKGDPGIAMYGAGGDDAGGAAATAVGAAAAAAAIDSGGGDDDGADADADVLGPVDRLIPILLPACPRASLPPLPPSTLQRLRSAHTPESTVLELGTTVDSGLLATSATNLTEQEAPITPTAVTGAEAEAAANKAVAAAGVGSAGAAVSPLPVVPPAAVSQRQAAAADALPADLAVVIHTALGIASGVAYLHSRSIIHGDLSANNVLLMRTANPGMPVVAKLSDFGLSMRLPAGQDQLKDVHHGTPYYQSPEVMERGTCSLAADVYSLGVLLWELYHGPPPWRARKRKHTAAAKKPLAAESAAGGQAREAGPSRRLGLGSDGAWHDPDYRLRACDVLEIAPHCPNRYARLVRRCLAPEPRDRPSARSVVKELLRLERGIAAAASLAPAPAAAGAGGAAPSAVVALTSPPAGAVLALARPPRQAAASAAATGAGGNGGRVDDALLLLEDYDAAAAAVAAALARVTARPTAEGAPASVRAAVAKPAGVTATQDGHAGRAGADKARMIRTAPNLALVAAAAAVDGDGGGGAAAAAVAPLAAGEEGANRGGTAGAPAVDAPGTSKKKPAVGIMTLE